MAEMVAQGVFELLASRSLDIFARVRPSWRQMIEKRARGVRTVKGNIGSWKDGVPAYNRVGVFDVDDLDARDNIAYFTDDTFGGKYYYAH